jgi:hypothetical protein
VIRVKSWPTMWPIGIGIEIEIEIELQGRLRWELEEPISFLEVVCAFLAIEGRQFPTVELKKSEDLLVHDHLQFAAVYQYERKR